MADIQHTAGVPNQLLKLRLVHRSGKEQDPDTFEEHKYNQKCERAPVDIRALGHDDFCANLFPLTEDPVNRSEEFCTAVYDVGINRHWLLSIGSGTFISIIYMALIIWVQTEMYPYNCAFLVP